MDNARVVGRTLCVCDDTSLYRGMIKTERRMGIK